MSDKPQGL